MKVLLLNGSPHEKGCTYTALREVADTLEKEGVETEIFFIGNQAVRGCIGCGECAKSGTRRCVFKDDRVNEALDKMLACDGLVVGSPVHYASAGGSITSFLDRMFYAAEASFGQRSEQPSSARGRAGTTSTLDQLNKYFTICGHADCAEPILVHGTRQHAGGCPPGRRGHADYAHARPLHGVHDEELCPCARKRVFAARYGEAEKAHQLYSVTASSL